MATISENCIGSVPAPTSIARPQITDHPVFTQMRALAGMDDDGALRAAIVYLDLFENKRWWGVDFRNNETSSLMFIFGSPTRNGNRHVIIPIATDTKLTIRTLRHYLMEGHKARNDFYSQAPNTSMEFLKPNKPETSSPTIASSNIPSTSVSSCTTASSNPPSDPSSTPPSSSPKVTLAIVSRDGTLVYYQLADGLLRPQRPLTAAQRLHRDALKRLGKAGIGGGDRKETEERLWVGKKPRLEEKNVEEEPIEADAEMVERGEDVTEVNEEANEIAEKEEDDWMEANAEGGGGGEWTEDTEGFWD